MSGLISVGGGGGGWLSFRLPRAAAGVILLSMTSRETIRNRDIFLMPFLLSLKKL